MTKKLQLLLLAVTLLAVTLLTSSCSSDLSPYKGYNKDGYTVSVRFDANGGMFDTNVTILTDSYNLSEFQTNADGKKEIRLFAPEDESMRGNQTYTAEKVNYYLAGWYTERSETVDADGNVFHTFSGRWNFESDRLSVDATQSYSSDTPVITLYAAWVPAFTYEFYTLDGAGNATLLEARKINPLDATPLKLPGFDEKTGQIGSRNDFPMLTDLTYDKIYTDPAMQNEITTETLTHSGSFDQETATLENPVMKIYCTTLDGLWFEVDSAERITKNSYLNANYILKNDIDFAGKTWPTTFLSKNFTGSIVGNGYSIKNVTVTQPASDKSAVNFGLFGQLTERVSFSDVTFDNITLNINGGSRMQGPSFGILAGTIAENAEMTNVVVKNSKLVFSSKSTLTFAYEPSLGLVSGFGPLDGITFSENNTVAFADDALDPSAKVEYEPIVPDADGRFQLIVKSNDGQ